MTKHASPKHATKRKTGSKGAEPTPAGDANPSLAASSNDCTNSTNGGDRINCGNIGGSTQSSHQSEPRTQKRLYFMLIALILAFFVAITQVPEEILDSFPQVPATFFQARFEEIMGDLSTSSVKLKQYLERQMIDRYMLAGSNISISSEYTSLLDTLYASIDFRPVGRNNSASAPERPSKAFLAENLTIDNFPVVMMPGFTSTGLEVWVGKTCASQYFRQRMWGTFRMIEQFMMNNKCWLEHMMMDPVSGLDPEGVKLRAAQGLEAADFVIGGYWVWGKIIENLADIGLDNNNMFMAAYDWRLSPELMEERDFYFTKLLSTIDLARATNSNKKVVVLAHSYGANLFLFFLQWVAHPSGGNRGAQWADQNIEALVDIAGPFFGIPKAYATLLSGEMKETAQLGSITNVLEYFFSPLTRASLVRTWTSLHSMLPMGGTAVWGDEASAPDDFVSRTYPNSSAVMEEIANTPEEVEQKLAEFVQKYSSNGAIIRFSDNATAENVTAGNYRTRLAELDQVLDPVLGLRERDAPPFKERVTWMDPVKTPLPELPNMQIYCLYGVGIASERGYFYKKAPPCASQTPAAVTEGFTSTGAIDRNGTLHSINPHSKEGEELEERQEAGDSSWTEATAEGAGPEETQAVLPPGVPYLMDTSVTRKPYISAGVRYTDGDGSIPLISLGYMCRKGWADKKRNPGGAKIVTREHIHAPVSMFDDPRGGPATSDHVDIMGNSEVIYTVLQVVSGNGQRVRERILSDIDSIAARVHLPDP